eukprot:351101_1
MRSVNRFTPHLIQASTGAKKLNSKLFTLSIKFESNSNVAIIGGGMSGLGTLKELKQIGFNPTLFEYSNDIGGNWDYKNDKCAGYKDMISNSGYTVWPFSDYVYNTQQHGYSTGNHPEFCTIEQVHSHLSNYAKHFNLYEHIKFNSNVTNINKNNTNNKWEVTIDNNNTNSFDRIVLCCGTASYPSYPDHLNIDILKQNFAGDIYHSKDIQTIDSFDNKNILIIGNGVSAFDIAEYSCIKNAKCVFNLYRSPRVILKLWQTNNQNGNYDYTVDKYLMSKNGMNAFNPQEYILLLDEYGFKTPDIANTPPEQIKFSFGKGVEYFCKKGILKGIHGEIDTVNEKAVHLKNNNEILNDIDMIIFATGYNVNNPYNNILSENIISKFYKPEIKTNRHLLYLLTFIPGYENDNIAFVGANQIIGALTYEMQSRLISQVWSGDLKLPSIEKQNEWIKNKLIDFDPFWYLLLIPA